MSSGVKIYKLRIFTNPISPASTRNWDDLWPALGLGQAERPSSGNLSWSAPLRFRELFDGMHKLQVGLEILTLEAR